jgi:hypothetical protein
MYHFSMATRGAEHIPLWPQRDDMDYSQSRISCPWLPGLSLFVVAGQISKQSHRPCTGFIPASCQVCLLESWCAANMLWFIGSEGVTGGPTYSELAQHVYNQLNRLTRSCITSESSRSPDGMRSTIYSFSILQYESESVSRHLLSASRLCLFAMLGRLSRIIARTKLILNVSQSNCWFADSQEIWTSCLCGPCF